ncbi:TPA: BamA/TamA family outer membrane protein [Klebsiella aerogenes]|uniref:BamA/TamA family outer membrane protein n=1 Tax=Klebsiella aerogenes TaxID=548 RepID=A0AAW9LP40_KLEAE|nr:BamA/TamA family outer membrane protein [Klebsiella aerogenes]ELA2473452.1 BamA/TamA family outer membrane protein [Klebsiella aerogenes]MCD0204924.1 outer membrane protein assembly factor [Klebsiella aerogenes]MDY0880329.1 BamA/TamA family outer membrane protein [Klebsiella aerogenes]MEA8799921.1 BamA/TamA family outer membrane protein [Klebsiella aerogenes]NPE18695.1 BamA/TamA family outer membrane protein [Klebsiella aerogenes]
MLLTCLVFGQVQAQALSREEIDGWLQNLGASDKFDASKGIDWGVMPGPFYTPELGLGLGTAVVGMYRPDPSDAISQNSTLTLSGYVSSTGAFGLSVKNYAFFDNDLWRIFVEGSMANTPTYYWGQGFHAGDKDNDKEKYTAQVLTLRPMVYRQLIDNVYLGAGWSLAAQNADEMDHDDLPKIENTPQGPSVFSSGASIDINWDDRDFVPNPRKGQYANFRYTHYAPGLGSDTRFDEFRLHYSRYQALSDKSVLAWEADGTFTQGDVPWSMMPLLGSDERMRGYYQGRYRDKNVVSSQLEYRRQLTWRHGVVAWVGAGTMGPSIDSLNDGRWLPSAGVGYRFEFKPRVNIRLDYGVGKGSSGFYFQVGEAF